MSKLRCNWLRLCSGVVVCVREDLDRGSHPVYPLFTTSFSCPFGHVVILGQLFELFCLAQTKCTTFAPAQRDKVFVQPLTGKCDRASGQWMLFASCIIGCCREGTQQDGQRGERENDPPREHNPAIEMHRPIVYRIDTTLPLRWEESHRHPPWLLHKAIMSNPIKATYKRKPAYGSKPLAPHRKITIVPIKHGHNSRASKMKITRR